MSTTFDPCYEALMADWLARYGGRDRLPLIGISGAQGCGKSSLAAHLAAKFGCAHVSLDDFYVTKAERLALAEQIHPLFVTRGLPLTHDLALARDTILALRRAAAVSETPLPAFDKIADDRRDLSDWPLHQGRPKAIIIEGWCLGATSISPVELSEPINDFEQDHDPDSRWRTHWNMALDSVYQDFFAQFDAILHLTAPSFDVVLDWRCEQQEGLLGFKKGSLPNEQRAELSQFVASFERLTRHMFMGGVKCEAVAKLDAQRRVLALEKD